MVPLLRMIEAGSWWLCSCVGVWVMMYVTTVVTDTGGSCTSTRSALCGVWHYRLSHLSSVSTLGSLVSRFALSSHIRRWSIAQYYIAADLVDVTLCSGVGSDSFRYSTH